MSSVFRCCNSFYFSLQMTNEFYLQSGTNEDAAKERWARCQERILKYAPLEQKKAVKALLKDMTCVEEMNDGMTYAMVLYILFMYSVHFLEQTTLYALLLLVALLNIRARSQGLLTVIKVS